MSNNDPVNDMNTPVCGLINDLDKAMKTKSSQRLNEAPLSRGRDCMVPIWPSSSFLFWTGLPTA